MGELYYLESALNPFPKSMGSKFNESIDLWSSHSNHFLKISILHPFKLLEQPWPTSIIILKKRKCKQYLKETRRKNKDEFNIQKDQNFNLKSSQGKT